MRRPEIGPKYFDKLNKPEPGPSLARNLARPEKPGPTYNSGWPSGGDKCGGCGDVYLCDQWTTVVKYERTGITAFAIYLFILRQSCYRR